MSYRGVHLDSSSYDVWFLTTVEEVCHLDTSGTGVNAKHIALMLDAWTGLLADSPLTSYDSPTPLRVFTSFRRKFLQGPLLGFVKDFAVLADTIVKQTNLTGSDTLTGVFVQEMRDTPVFKEYLTWYRTGDPALLGYLLSFLYFGKKMDYEDPAMDSTALRGWKQVEERLCELELPVNVVNDLRHIQRRLLSCYKFNPWSVKFGPGAVAEKGIRGSIKKSNNILCHPRLDRLLTHRHRSGEGYVRGDGSLLDGIFPDVEKWDKAGRCSGDVSELLFAPKDVTKSRSICKEPNSFMWAQQAVCASLVTAFKEGHMAKISNLADQSINRKLALYGSYTTEIDTIDLSSASDSVSVQLVREIMPANVLHDLLATRTSKVRLPDGEVVSVRKFAPMGSAVCFPTQCLVFASVVILSALQESEGFAIGDTRTVLASNWSNFDQVLDTLFAERPGYYKGRTYQPFAVYGDDIAVDTRLTTRVVHLLTVLGFEVNSSKSFTAGQAFRESCGGYYWNGEDVTPLRFSVMRDVPRQRAGHVASAVSLSNRAGDRGFRVLQRTLMHYSLQFGPIRFSSRRPNEEELGEPGGLAFYSDSPRNTHLQRRDDICVEQGRDKNRYQREEYKCLTLLPEIGKPARPFEKDAHDRYQYGRWWMTRAGGFVTEGLSFGVPRSVASGSRLGRRWMPVE